MASNRERNISKRLLIILFYKLVHFYIELKKKFHFYLYVHNFNIFCFFKVFYFLKEIVQNYFKEITECETEMSSILTIFTPERGKTFLNSKFLFESLQNQVKRTNSWRDRVIKLHEKGLKISITGEPILHKRFRSLCSLKSGNIQLSKGDEFFIQENQGERVKVKTSQGSEGIIPALSCIVPSPDLSAKNASERLQLVLLAVLNDSWKRFKSALIQSVSYNYKYSANDWKRKVRPSKTLNRDRIARRFKRLNEVVIKFPTNFDITKLNKALYSLERELVDCKANENIIETIAYLHKATLCFESFTKQYEDYKSSLAELSKPILVVERLADLQNSVNKTRNFRYLEMKMTLTEVETTQTISYKDEKDFGKSTKSLRTCENKRIIRRNSKKYLNERNKFLKRLQKLNNNITMSSEKSKYVRFGANSPKVELKFENSHEIKSIKKRRNTKCVYEMIKEDLKTEKKYLLSWINPRNTYIINNKSKKDSGKDQLETKNIVYPQNIQEGQDISVVANTGRSGLALNTQANSTISNGSYSSDGFQDKQTTSSGVHSFSSDFETESSFRGDNFSNYSSDILSGDKITSNNQSIAFKNSFEEYSSFDDEKIDPIDVVLEANNIQSSVVEKLEYNRTFKIPESTLISETFFQKVNIDPAELKNANVSLESGCQEFDSVFQVEDQLVSEQCMNTSKAQGEESPISIESRKSNSTTLKRNRSFESALRLSFEDDKDETDSGFDKFQQPDSLDDSAITPKVEESEIIDKSRKNGKESNKGKKNDFAKSLKEKWKKTFSKQKNQDKEKKRKNNFSLFKRGKSKKLKSDEESSVSESPVDNRRNIVYPEDDDSSIRYQRLEFRRNKLRNSCSNIDKLTRKKYSDDSIINQGMETTFGVDSSEITQKMDLSENKENLKSPSKRSGGSKTDLVSNIMHTNVDSIGKLENDTQNKANTLIEDGMQTKKSQQDSALLKGYEVSMHNNEMVRKSESNAPEINYTNAYTQESLLTDAQHSKSNLGDDQVYKPCQDLGSAEFKPKSLEFSPKIERKHENLQYTSISIPDKGKGKELLSEVSSISDDYVLAREYLESPKLGTDSSAYSTPSSCKKLSVKNSHLRGVRRKTLLKGIESEISSTSEEYEQAFESLTDLNNSKVVSSSSLTCDVEHTSQIQRGLESPTGNVINIDKTNVEEKKEKQSKHFLTGRIISKQDDNKKQDAKLTTFQSTDVDTLLKDQSKAQIIDPNKADYRCCIDFPDEGQRIKIKDTSIKNMKSIKDSSEDPFLNTYRSVNNETKQTPHHSNPSANTPNIYNRIQNSEKTKVCSKITTNDDVDTYDGSDSDQLENAWQGAIIIRDFRNRSSIRRRRSRSLPSYLKREQRTRPAPIKSVNYRATSNAKLDWRISCSIKRQLIATENLRSTKKETKKIYAIKGILNPNDAMEEFSLKEAIDKGVINLKTGKYINPETKDETLSIPIQEAVKLGLILLKQLDEEEGKEESKNYGLITIQTLLDCRNFHIKECLNNGEWISAEEARRLHVLNESEGVFQTPERQISLEEAVKTGLVSIEYEESNDAPNEEEAIESYCIRAVVDQKNRVSVPFQEAIERGLLDPKTAEYINNKTGEKVFLVDALSKGFLKVTEVDHENCLESIDPDKRPTVEKVIGLIRKAVVTPISFYNALKISRYEN